MIGFTLMITLLAGVSLACEEVLLNSPIDCARLFKDNDCRGEALAAEDRGPVTVMPPGGWNDVVSSVSVKRGCTLTLYKNGNLADEIYEIQAPVTENISQRNLGVASDQTSSYSCFCPKFLQFQNQLYQNPYQNQPIINGQLQRSLPATTVYSNTVPTAYNNPIQTQFSNQIQGQLGNPLANQFSNPLQSAYPNQLLNQYPNPLLSQTAFQGQYPNQFLNQYPNQFLAQYPNQFQSQFPNQFQGQYPNQFAGQYPNQFAGQYPNQFAGQYPNQFAGQDQSLLQNQLLQSQLLQSQNFQSNPLLQNQFQQQSFPNNLNGK